MLDHGNYGPATLNGPGASASQTDWLPDSAPAWFALAVKPRCDKAVARTLELKGYETFLPLYKDHKYGARSKETELPLFPGYVFCRFDALKRLPILITPGVTHILGTGGTPTPLCDREVFSLQTAMQTQLPIQVYPFLETGQKVRIKSGVLAGVEGIVIDQKQFFRIVLSITLLQRSVLLEIDRDRVDAEQTVRAGGAEFPADEGSLWIGV